MVEDITSIIGPRQTTDAHFGALGLAILNQRHQDVGTHAGF